MFQNQHYYQKILKKHNNSLKITNFTLKKHKNQISHLQLLDSRLGECGPVPKGDSSEQASVYSAGCPRGKSGHCRCPPKAGSGEIWPSTGTKCATGNGRRTYVSNSVFSLKNSNFMHSF